MTFCGDKRINASKTRIDLGIYAYSNKVPKLTHKNDKSKGGIDNAAITVGCFNSPFPIICRISMKTKK